jgi:uncharacterized SAM-binding protein YcdF (DUF218 family)
LLSNGNLPREFILQMEKAIQLLRQSPASAELLISGGITRPGFPSEARAALYFVPQDLFFRVRLEEESLSTRQNIIFAKRLFHYQNADCVVVVTSRGHAWRARYLFRKLWPEMKQVSFESVGGSGIRDRIAHAVLYALTVLDPDEDVFLPLKTWLLSRKTPASPLPF